LYLEEHSEAIDIPPNFTPPQFEAGIRVHHSATATFYAPSDLCGTGGLLQERIRSMPYCHGGQRYDTVFVELDSSKPGLLGMVVAQVLLFFSFEYRRKTYFCALVHWYVRESDERDEDTGMWTVRLECRRSGQPVIDVISVDSIARASHLLPIYGNLPVPERFSHFNALAAYKSFFVNHFTDHHTFELILG